LEGQLSFTLRIDMTDEAPDLVNGSVVTPHDPPRLVCVVGYEAYARITVTRRLQRG